MLKINMAVFDQRNLVSQLCTYVENDITYLDRAVVRKIIENKWLDHTRAEYIK